MYAMNQHAKYLGRRSFRSKVTVRTRPLRWSVIIERFHQLVSHERGTKRGFSLRLKCFSRGHRPPRWHFKLSQHWPIPNSKPYMFCYATNYTMLILTQKPTFLMNKNLN